MRVIAFIHDQDVIRKILEHLNLWDIKRKPFQYLPVRLLTQTGTFDSAILYDQSHGPGIDDYIIDPQYPAEAYF